MALFLWSTPVLLWSELSHEVMLKRKIWQNLLQWKHAGLTSFRWPVVLIDHNFFLQLLYATHQGFPISERTHLTQVSIKLLWLFTYLLSDAKSLKWAYRELQKVKMSQALKWKKGVLFFYLNSDKLETTLTPTLDPTILYFLYWDIQHTCGYVLALDSPLCCISACCYGSLFMKHSSPALIRTEPRGHDEKKI